MRGVFVTFEGPEGCGKTTQLKRLVDRLKERGCEVVESREPGGTAVGDLIRNLVQHDSAGEALSPLSEAFLFAAARTHHVDTVIRPAVERGAWVVCDRFGDCTAAYQGYGRGVDLDLIDELNARAMGDVVPDLTFLLDVDVAHGMRRVRKRIESGARGLDRFEREDTAFHERVRQGYLALAERDPERIHVVDGGREAEVVAGDIWRLAKRFLPDAAAGEQEST